MATKSSIHIKPCNIASSEAHNRRTAEYMRHIGESRIYVVPELSTDNEQWINPDFGSPDLRTHYDNIRQMVKEKTGRAMQEKERERKGKNGKIVKIAGCSPYVKECCLSGRTPHWQTCVNSVRSVKDAGESHRCKSSCTRMKGIG